MSEAICTHTAARINFLLGLVKRCQKLPIFVAPECIQPASSRNESRLERFALQGWQALDRRFDFRDRAHSLTLEHHFRSEQPLLPILGRSANWTDSSDGPAEKIEGTYTVDGKQTQFTLRKIE